MSDAVGDFERWRPVVGFEDRYEVSSLGRVRSLARIDSLGRQVPRRILKAPLTPYDYPRVTLHLNGARSKARVHVLVAEAFLGPRPSGMEVCHVDGDPANNAVTNLRWDTHRSNQRDVVRHGRHHRALSTSCINGHPFDEANTLLRRNGGRDCRTCKRARQAAWQARKSEAAA